MSDLSALFSKNISEKNQINDNSLNKKAINFSKFLWNALPWLPGFLWWITFFPGIDVHDTLYTYRQVESRIFGTDQTLAWPLYVFTFSLGGRAYFFVTLINWLLLTFIIKKILSTRFSEKASSATTFTLMSTPSFGAAAIHVWHDSTFSIGLLVLIFYMIQLIKNQKLKKIEISLMYFAVVLINTRLNGLIILLITLSISLLIFRKKDILKRSIHFIFLSIGISIFLPLGLLGQGPSKPSFSMQILAADINCVASSNPEVIDESTWKYLERIDSRESWQNGDSCIIVNRLFWGKNFNREVIDLNPKKFFNTWLMISEKKPETVLNAHIKRADSFIFPPLKGKPDRMFFLNIWEEGDQRLQGHFGPIGKAAVLYIASTDLFGQILGWSGLWYVFIVIFVLFRLYINKKAMFYIWYLIPISVNQFFLIIFTPAPESRYALSTIWLGSISMLFLIKDFYIVMEKIRVRVIEK